MKGSKLHLITDLSFLTLVFLMFVVTAFIAIDPAHINLNLVLLAVAALVMIVTYFSTLAIGVSLATAVVLLGMGVAVYFGLEKGMEIPNLVYFWAVLLPLFSLVCASFVRNTHRLQHAVATLEKNMADLVTIDDLTGLKNLKQFTYDANAFMNIAKRYKLKLALVTVGLRFQNDIERVVGKQNLNEVIISMSDGITQSLRNEDLIYLTDTQQYLWAVLMMTNDFDGIAFAIQRIKKNIAQINVQEISRFSQVDLELRVGVANYDNQYSAPLDFLNAAKKEMEYDV